MNQPNVDLLNELFLSEEWKALKTEIEQFRDNSLFRLKRENEVNRDYQAGMVSAYEDILRLGDHYKNADIKRIPNDQAN